MLLLRKVYGKPGLGTLFQEYHANSDAVRITEKEAKHFIDTENRSALSTLKSDRSGEYSMINLRRKTDSQLNKLRKKRKQIQASNLSESQKQRKLEEVSTAMERLMNNFNRMYNQRVEP